MHREQRRILGLVLFLVGIASLVYGHSVSTGAAVGTYAAAKSFSLSGIVLLVIALAIIFTATLESTVTSSTPVVGKRRTEERVYTQEKGYYRERVLELTKDSREVWASQFELPGLIQELEGMGFGVRGPEIHFGGRTGPNIRHLNVNGRNAAGVKLKHKHIFITTDPYDSRLKHTSYGFHSKVYTPNHPRYYVH